MVRIVCAVCTFRSLHTGIPGSRELIFDSLGVQDLGSTSQHGTRAISELRKTFPSLDGAKLIWVKDSDLRGVISDRINVVIIVLLIVFLVNWNLHEIFVFQIFVERGF